MTAISEQSKDFASGAPVPGEIYVLTDPSTVLDDIVAIVLGATVETDSNK
jgi:hypothetical protein